MDEVDTKKISITKTYSLSLYTRDVIREIANELQVTDAEVLRQAVELLKEKVLVKDRLGE